MNGPTAALTPSGQHPKAESSQVSVYEPYSGQPAKCRPDAACTPSRQHPCSVSAQLVTFTATVGAGASPVVSPQPCPSLPPAGRTPSAQHPYVVAEHGSAGQPSKSGPCAVVTPSWQQPNSESSQTAPRLGHCERSASAAVTPSGQQPNSVSSHALSSPEPSSADQS